MTPDATNGPGGLQAHLTDGVGSQVSAIGGPETWKPVPATRGCRKSVTTAGCGALTAGCGTAAAGADGSGAGC